MPVQVLASEQSSPEQDRTLGFFIRIDADGSIWIGSSQPEMGQGVKTALPMLIAEELDADWQQVSVNQMPLGIVKTADGYTWKYGGQGVGGSTAVSRNWQFLREVGATARQMLVQAAAAYWQVPEQECQTENGWVIHNNKRLSYASLAPLAASLEVPEQAPKLKKPADFHIIGTPCKVVDGRDIVTGQAKYGWMKKCRG